MSSWGGVTFKGVRGVTAVLRFCAEVQSAFPSCDLLKVLPSHWDPTMFLLQRCSQQEALEADRPRPGTGPFGLRALDSEESPHLLSSPEGGVIAPLREAEKMK